MRYSIIAIACCLSGLGSAWLLADDNASARPQRSASYRSLVERFDRDGDGRLNDRERQAARSASDERRQRDGNQSRATRETSNRNRSTRDTSSRNRSAGTNNRSRLTTDQRAELLRRFDANKNGKLDPPELTRMRQSMSRGANGSNTRPQRSSGNSRMSRDELLKRFDANRNGRIDGKEMQKVRAMSGRSDRDSVQPTAPKEGRLDRDELMKRFDLDDNGRLDAAERKQAFEAMRKKKVQ